MKQYIYNGDIYAYGRKINGPFCTMAHSSKHAINNIFYTACHQAIHHKGREYNWDNLKLVDDKDLVMILVLIGTDKERNIIAEKYKNKYNAKICNNKDDIINSICMSDHNNKINKYKDLIIINDHNITINDRKKIVKIAEQCDCGIKALILTSAYTYNQIQMPTHTEGFDEILNYNKK